MMKWRGEELMELYDHLPQVVFYAKDLEGRFVRCNQRFEEVHGLQEGGAVGKTDFDLHPAEIASGYRAEDEKVLSAGEALPNQVWMVPDGQGVLHWWISSKIPLRDGEGQVIGTAGVMYEVSTAAGVMGPYRRIEGALRVLHERFSEPLRSEELAGACYLSVSQFNRIFRKSMQQSPKSYLNRLRLNAAKSLLIETDLTQSEVALRVGYYDGSEFGKRFREEEGLTPREYRARLREMARAGGS
ncbi:AraC family transcriptional regulator [Verrucomicrobiaceae bacterium 227]